MSSIGDFIVSPDLIGSKTETAPASDTASSGLNGRLQRVSQRITALIAQIPAALGQLAKAASLSVTIASDDDLQGKIGATNETAPTTDTAASGSNGRLQRIAQRLTALLALYPTLVSGRWPVDGSGVTQPAQLVAGTAIVGKVGIDQTTPGTTDRATVGKTVILDVTLSLDTSAYASGDLLADTQAIANLGRANDMGGVLQFVQVIDEDDQGVAFDIYFLDANNTLGSENSTPSISDANARAILGKVPVAISDYTDLGGVKVATIAAAGMPLRPVSGGTTGYLAVVNGTGAPTYTASGVRIRLGFLQD